MATFHKTFAAALVAAVGLMLPAKATPLPYTSETTCSVAYGDGSTSAECDGYYTNEFTEFRGAEGSNTVFAYAGGGAMVSNARLNHEDGSVYFEPWDVVSANVIHNLWFTGITLGPVRPGIAEVMVDTYGSEDGPPTGGWRALASFAGGPKCGDGLLLSCHAWQEIPITLGQTFSFSILFTAFAGSEWGADGFSQYSGGGGGTVQVTIWDAAGNPVPIYASSAVPEPGHLASIGLALIGAYVIRCRTKG